MGTLRIGEVAKQAGVNLDTIRYYERRGLLPKPPRTAANYRTFPADTVRRVRFVKRAQELGFTLDEIKELLSLRARPQARCADVYRRAEAKIGDIDLKMRSLRSIREALAALMAQCAGQEPATDCPILEAMAGGEERG